jgi:hypothetical protein
VTAAFRTKGGNLGTAEGHHAKRVEAVG